MDMLQLPFDRRWRKLKPPPGRRHENSPAQTVVRHVAYLLISATFRQERNTRRGFEVMELDEDTTIHRRDMPNGRARHTPDGLNVNSP